MPIVCENKWTMGLDWGDHEHDTEEWAKPIRITFGGRWFGWLLASFVYLKVETSQPAIHQPFTHSLSC
jgi:hypothetical protein